MKRSHARPALHGAHALTGASGPQWRALAGVACVVGAVLALVLALGLQELLLVLAVATEAIFIAYFVRHLGFAIAALRASPPDLSAPLVETGFLPTVSVLVGCKNEAAVLDILVSGLLALDYSADRLQVIVVDDGSDDGTGELLDALAASNPGLTALHRPPGAGGGKSGALNRALDVATGEIIVIFDADHRPRPDVLRRLVRHFADPKVGAAQGRCEIVNGDDTPIANLVALDYLAGYLVNEYGRQALYQLPAYGGANCAVRADALRALGGWNEDSVTEDTDLTLRLVLAGWRLRYDVTAVDEEEGVVTLQRYWNQRYRWARGHQEVWRTYRRAVWRSEHLSFGAKVETTMFLLAFHVPVLSGLGVLLLVAWLAGWMPGANPLGLSVLWMLLFLGPLLEIGSGLLIGRARRRLAWSLAYFLPLFYVSISLCTKAWVDGLFSRNYAWVKTARASEPDRPADAILPSSRGGGG